MLVIIRTLHWDQGNPSDVIYLDFAKAFDKIPRERLAANLERVAECEDCCSLGRTFSVRVRDTIMALL